MWVVVANLISFLQIKMHVSGITAATYKMMESHYNSK